MQEWDAIVIGAGYFGSRIALHLARHGMRRVALVDAEPELMARASRWNQNRVHGGYHYPRSPLTARASRRSYRRFVEDNADAVRLGMQAFYAVARGSAVSPSQFQKACEAIGARLLPAGPAAEQMFDRELIEAVYQVDEIGFDPACIAARLNGELARAGVTLMLGTRARIARTDPDLSIVDAERQTLRARYVFNCTYSSLDRIGVSIDARLRREWSEMALVEPPPLLAGRGVTVMDGPFFSLMPFGSGDTATVSHVRYTPVAAWADEAVCSRTMRPGPGAPVNSEAMLRDASRYLPRMRDARLRGAIFEMKAVMQANEADDGRPILMERHRDAPNVISVLGSKLDNIYDLLDTLDDILAENREAVL